MPNLFTCDFKIRRAEIDAYGHLHHSHYLRLAQEAAIRASTAVGYDEPAYARLGTHWLIRESGMEYVRPVVYGETLRVTTWVSSASRVRSRREYEIRTDGGSEPSARGYTDWIYMDAATGQPARIPAEMVTAFLPDPTEPAPHHEPFPATPEPPPDAHRSRRRVQFYELDELRHVNNAVYLDYLEQAGVEAAEARGWPMDRLLGLDIAIVARQHRIEYLRPAQYGDELVITTWLSNRRPSSVMRHYTVHLASGKALARARTHFVWIRFSTGRPTPIPEEIAKDFEVQ